MRKFLFALIIVLAEAAIAFAIGDRLLSVETPAHTMYVVGFAVGGVLFVINTFLIIVFVRFPLRPGPEDRYQKVYYFNPDPTNTQPTPPCVQTGYHPHDLPDLAPIPDNKPYDILGRSQRQRIRKMTSDEFKQRYPNGDGTLAHPIVVDDLDVGLRYMPINKQNMPYAERIPNGLLWSPDTDLYYLVRES